jgi:clan AA aspartic protease (TIGR02281 family)
MPRLAIFFLMISFAASAINADTVYLKNGGIVEGVIEKEDEKKVELNTGFGSVTFQKQQIKRIESSSSEENDKIIKKWEGKKKELDAEAKEFEDARKKRSDDAYENWMEEAHQKKSSQEGEAKDVQVARDESGRHIIAEVLLNDKVKASLMMDTGASLIVLSKRIGDELGVDTTDTGKDMMVLKLADGRTSNAKAVILDSVKIDDVETRKVMAAVLLDQVPDPSLKDGLLGMSFLSRFNIKMNLKTMKMSLEKLEKQE